MNKERRKLRILMFAPKFSPFIGGAERQVENLSEEMSSRGFHVTVLTPHLDKESKQYEKIKGFEIVRFNLLDLNELFPKIRGLGLLNIFLLNIQIARLARKYFPKYDIIHGHNVCILTLFVAKHAEKLSTPVIWKGASAGKKSDFSTIKAIPIISNMLFKNLLIDMKRWIATTAAVRDTMIDNGVNTHDITKIPNGVVLANISSIKKHYDANELVRFLYLGRINSNMDRDVFGVIKAFEKVESKNSSAELALVGGGDMLEEITDVVKSLRCSEKIKCPGFDDPEKWLKKSDVFILPSRREGLSNALLEAMSGGLACIAYDIPPNREVLGDGEYGELVPINDINMMARKMIALIEDPEKRRNFGLMARRRVEKDYSIQSVVTKYLELYEQIIDKTSSE